MTIQFMSGDNEAIDQFNEIRSMHKHGSLRKEKRNRDISNAISQSSR